MEYAADMDGTDDETPAQVDPSRAESLCAHAEGSISEDALLAAARERSVEIGAGAVTPAVGALLSLLAKLSGGKAVAEVGYRPNAAARPTCSHAPQVPTGER